MTELKGSRCIFTAHIVFKYIMQLAPSHAPFLARPLVNYITSQIAGQAAEPNLKAEINMVRILLRRLSPDYVFSASLVIPC